MISGKELKKQAIGQSLHLSLGIAMMAGVAAPASPDGVWAAVSIAAAFVGATIVHAINRTRKDKPVFYQWNDAYLVGVIAAVSVTWVLLFGVDHWAEALAIGMALGIARELMQQPTERVDDAILDVVVTVIGAVVGFFAFAAIAKAVG